MYNERKHIRIRRIGEAILEKQSKNLFAYIGESKVQREVGFILDKNLKNCIEEFQGISERIAILRLKISGHSIVMTQTHAQTSIAAEEDLVAFYTQLDTISINFREAETRIVMGDLTARQVAEKMVRNLFWVHIVTKTEIKAAVD